MAPSVKAQYYLAEAEGYLKQAAAAPVTASGSWSGRYRKLMDLAREYRNLAAIEQGLAVPSDPDRER
jgi:hypothetical protein